MKLAAPKPVDETPDRAFNGPAFASAVCDLMADFQARRLDALQSILAANDRGDKPAIVRIVNQLIEEERRCA